MNNALFNIGEMLTHKTQGYWAIVVDIDANFQPSGKINPHIQADKLEKKGPWYRLLVHKSSLVTYVSESELEKAFLPGPISHPRLHEYLTLDAGKYRVKTNMH